MSRHKTLAIMGSTSVGKSALTCQFVKGTFPDYYDPTIAATYQVSFKSTNNINYELTLDDTAGLEQQSQIPYKYINSHGFILVYSITDRQSFEIIRDIFEKLKDVLNGERKPFILIGNKIDLSANRRISYEEGNMLANEMKAEFLETSAKLGNNVKDIFNLLLNAIDQPLSNANSSNQNQNNTNHVNNVNNNSNSNNNFNNSSNQKNSDKNVKTSKQANHNSNNNNCIIT